MSFHGDDDRTASSLSLTAERLQALASSLARLAAGVLPSEEDLAGAPLLTHWSHAVRPAPCLIGQCLDHPHRIGPRMISSDLWVVDPAGRWARTTSRFYRLGDPADPDGDPG